ncbi:MAG: undecaprenyl-diphosphate phosphatase [Micrococcaceae bacterium]
MEWWHAVLFGIIEGVTEFLPISSTGHLTIFEKLFGYKLDDPSVTAFTAIIQSGAVLATLLYLRKDIWRVGTAWFKGLVDRKDRNSDYRFGWAVILGSIPIAIVGLLFKDEIEGVLRSLWVVAAALILWSGVMWYADSHAPQTRHEQDTTWKDTLIIGTVQCMSLIPGISRSGATMSAGLLRGFDRVTVTRLSFFLSIPALLAATVLQIVTEYQNISGGVGWGPTITATVVSFVVAYFTVDWLLKFIARHNYSIFIWYRLALGTVLIALLSTGVLSPV